MFDDDAPAPSALYQIGADLSSLSIDELRERIDMLRDEITRIEGELSTKGSSRDAAESLFLRR